MIATVNATTGLATSLAVGSTVITAISGSVSGSVTLVVTAAIVESISITPNPASSGVGLPLQLIAKGTYSDGTIANVTTRATWASTATSVATVGPTTGIITGVALGSTTISAAIGAVTSTAPLSIVTNTWFPTGSLNTARFGHTTTLLPNGKVLVAGGTVAIFGNVTASMEVYDPGSGTWSATGSLATARSWHTATLLPNGKVLVTGGTNVSSSGGTTLASSELYDPAAGTWTATGSLATARCYHIATLLQNGDVLVTSGVANTQNGPDLTSSELYDPRTGAWSATGNLFSDHYLGAATLLQSGKVLIVGGFFDTALPNPVEAELYDPVAGTWSAIGNPVVGGATGDLDAAL
jgi:hypothetical protein